MKEKPDLQDRRIIALLRDIYGVDIDRVLFLPIGDVSSAKYQLVRAGSGSYFLKLKKGDFKEISVAVPHFLYKQGIHQIIPPLKTLDGQLWTNLDAYSCVLYPFVEGQNGFQNLLSESQWIELGTTLKAVHCVSLPPYLQKMIPFEIFSSTWRERVRGILSQVEHISHTNPTVVKMAMDMHAHRDEIYFVIDRAEVLGKALQFLSLDQVLCHTDIHAGNLLLETNGTVRIIDWDDPLLAPKERDLMFIGGGIGGIWNTAREERLFYLGYGRDDISPIALTYYRYERIVTDIAEFCQRILSTYEGGADRERSLQKFNSIFLPGQVFDIAYQTDQILKTRLSEG